MGLNCDVKWASVRECACHVFGVCVVQGMQPAGCWSGKLSAWSLSGVAAQHWSLLSFILHFTPSSHHSLPLYCLPPSFQWTSPPPPPPPPCCCFIAYLLPSLPFFSLSETSSPRLSCPFHFCSFHFLKASFFPIVSFPQGTSFSSSNHVYSLTTALFYLCFCSFLYSLYVSSL